MGLAAGLSHFLNSGMDGRWWHFCIVHLLLKIMLMSEKYESRRFWLQIAIGLKSAD